MSFLELFGQGKDSDRDRNGSFCIEDTVTAVAVELAFLLKLVSFMIFLFRIHGSREFTETLLELISFDKVETQKERLRLFSEFYCKSKKRRRMVSSKTCKELKPYFSIFFQVTRTTFLEAFRQPYRGFSWRYLSRTKWF